MFACTCDWTALARTTGGVGSVLRAALDKMVAGGGLPMPRPVTAAPPGKDLLEWWDSVSFSEVVIPFAVNYLCLEREAKLSAST